MFMLFEIEEAIGISPKDFGKPLKDVALKQFKEAYEGVVDENLGYVILVLDVDVDPLGLLLPRDGHTYHKCRVKLVTYLPKVQEVVEGEVVELTDFGAFVRIGPLDALLHISQIMDDYLVYDEKHAMLVGKKSGKKLVIGDDVRARIVAVSLGTGAMEKVGLTTRQPFLGKIDWIKKETGKEEVEGKVETRAG